MGPLDLLSYEGYKYLVEHYEKGEKSTYQVAEETGTSAYLVRKALAHHKMAIRSRSESLKIALRDGRRAHPTKGKKLSSKTKNAISEKSSKYWANIPKEKKEAHRAKAKAHYDALPEKKKEEIGKLAGDALRATSREGSRLEKWVMSELAHLGYAAQYHADLPHLGDMHVDIYLPEERVAIEVDGPSHYSPMWGEEKLAEMMAADHEKNGLLAQSSIRVIRVKQSSKYLSRPKLAKLSVDLELALSSKEVLVKLEI